MIKRICFSSYVWFLLICRKKRRKCCAGEFTVNRIWSFELLYCDKPGTLSSNSVSRSINFPHSSSIRAKKYCNFRGLRCYSGLHKTLEPRPLDPKFNTLLNTDLRVSDNLGPRRFSHSIYGPSTKRAGHKSKWKNENS